MATIELAVDTSWKSRFRAPVVLWSQIADRAPERGLVCSNESGIYQLHAWDVRSGALRQLTTSAHGKIFGSISPNGEYVYFHSDVKGNEIGTWVRIPFDGGEPESVTPDMEPYPSHTFSVCRDGSIGGFSMAGADGFHIYVLERPEGVMGTPRELFHSLRLAMGPALSADGTIAAIITTERSTTLQTEIVAVDVGTGERLGEMWDGEGTSVGSAGFAPIFAPKAGDARLLCTTNRTGTTRPFVWDVRSGERLDLPVEQLEGDVATLGWSPDSDEILLCQILQARHQLYVYSLATGNLRTLHAPAGTYGMFFASAYFAPDGSIYTHWQDSTHPLHLIALDARTGEPTGTLLPPAKVPPSRPWTSFTFASSDGQPIQGWVCVPEGEGPFPTILHTHGGPTAVEFEVFMPSCQAWVDRGYAFATINYRGSTTFGRAFAEQIFGDLGHWEVEDMAAARQWLIDQNIAIPEHIFLTGASYGGYLTLMGLGVRPELWAGGMAGVPVADWTTQYEDSAATLRAYERALFGGTPDDMPEQYRISSPITYVDRVAAPVYISHGRNDTRCPARPVEMYEARMRELGKPIEVQWLDAGHIGAFVDVEAGVDQQERYMRFADDVLNVRLQPIP